MNNIVLDNDILKCINSDNPDKEYKKLIIRHLKNNKHPDCQALFKRLKNNILDNQTDLLTRLVSDIYPFNLYMPYLRDILKFNIHSDEKCIKSLNSLSDYLKQNNKDEKEVIEKIKNFIKGEEIETSLGLSFELYILLDKIPIEKYPVLYNISDYIKSLEGDE